MKTKDYFLITHNDQKYLILAHDGIEAVNLWHENRDKQFEVEGRKMISRPGTFTVDKVVQENELIEASE